MRKEYIIFVRNASKYKLASYICIINHRKIPHAMNATLTAPAKFDRRAIAIAAWSLVKTAGKTLSQGMKAAWAAAKQTVKNVMTPTFAAPIFTARTSKGQVFEVVMNAAGQLSINGYATPYAVSQGRPAVHLNAATVKAVVGVTVASGAYLALDRAVTAADTATARAASAAATQQDLAAATAFATARRTGRRVELGYAGSFSASAAETFDVIAYAMPDGSVARRNKSHE